MWTSFPANWFSHLMRPPATVSPAAAGALVPPAAVVPPGAVVPPAAGAVVPPDGAAVAPDESFLSLPQAATRRPARHRAPRAPFRDFIYFPLRNGCTSI